MDDSIGKYGLDLHGTLILEEYREYRATFQRLRQLVLDIIDRKLGESGLCVAAVEARVKTEESLAGKLELKGSKYASLNDLTDIVGARIIAFYTDDVDKIAALMEKTFELDKECSVDKRRMHDLDSFGYNSLHYICRIPKSLYSDPQCALINEIRFEIQMRTALQHVWATLNHDIDYKSGLEVPREYLRSLNCLAGLLELADSQFSQIRTAINNYRRQVEQLVSNGNFDDVPLNGDTFRSYLQLKPFDGLVKRIAAINQAEIHESSQMPYLQVLKYLGFRTLGDVEKMRKLCTEEAFQLAVYQIGNTDLDIISSTIALQDLLVIQILKNGGGEQGLIHMFNRLNGETLSNVERAQRVLDCARQLPFMKFL
ncbi:MAG: hypothetical protein Q4E55_05935 [Bacteroidales bacterium]|nr:hypothetical protein [Bacteroidales bacterium]